jgi:AraC-like DNA-binding protein
VYREFAPAPAVAAVAAGSWYGRPGWTRSLRVLPDGCADLVWNGRELSIVITAETPLRVWLPPAEWVAGIRLRCGVAGSVLGQAMSELRVGATPLRELWGAQARRAEERLADSRSFADGRSVLESLIATRRFEPRRFSMTALASGARMAEVAGKMGVSERSLRRMVAHEVGGGPKQLQRVLRFQRFLRRLESVAFGQTSLAVVAAELGYADQSHLGRECRRLSGSSPASLLRTWARGRNVPDFTGDLSQDLAYDSAVPRRDRRAQR